LVISIPILLLLAVPFIDFDNFAKLDAYAWEQFLFLSFVNSLIGFFLWFKGMAMAGVRAASQIQLLQTFLTYVVGVTFSNETPSYSAAIFSILILVIIVFS
jgi:drug/metabolite transporter (DMT)-like permease